MCESASPAASVLFRAGGRTPLTPGRAGGGVTYAQGPHVMYEKKFLVFIVFKILVKIFVHYEIYRYSVVTYLIFEFLVPACYTYT